MRTIMVDGIQFKVYLDAGLNGIIAGTFNSPLADIVHFLYGCPE